MPERAIEVGDVVQIDGDHHPMFAACFAIVTKVAGWGVVVDVPVPAGPSPGLAPLRLGHGEYAVIGRAAWQL